MKTRTMVLAVFSILLSAWAPVRGAVETEDKGALMAAYRSALARLQDLHKNVQAEGSLEESFQKSQSASPKRKQSRVFYTAIKEHFRLGVVNGEWKDSTEKAAAEEDYFETIHVNDRGKRFAARRVSRQGPYTLAYLGNQDAAMESYVSEVKNYFYVSYMMGPFSLPVMVASPGFVVDSVERGSVDGESRLKIAFHYRIPPPEPISLKGWVSVAPDRGSVLREYEFARDDNPDPARVTGKVDYAKDDGEVPTPKSVEQRMLFKNGFEQNQNFTFDKFSHEVAPTQDFALASFGLGDMEFAATSRNDAPFWFFGVAAIALVVGLSLRAYGRRRSAAG